VSSDPGRRGTSSQGGGGGASGPVAARRLGLLVFGGAFLVLFIVVAIAEGIGDPGVPSGDAAHVEDVPGDFANVTEDEVTHAIELAAAQGGEQKPPKAGTPKYEELKETAMNSVLEGVWIRGQADEWGIEVSDAEVAKEEKKLKQESFKSKKEFRDFLKESGFTPADVTERVEIQVLSTKLQEQLQEKAPEPSEEEVEKYYEAAKATQFTQPPSRDVRLIVNKDRKKAKQARELLTKDNSAANWKKVAKKFSEDPATKENGGLQQGVPEGTLEEPLGEAVFNTPEGQIDGPLDAQRGFTVFEVSNTTPESTQELKAVESQIKGTLAQQTEQEYFASFLSSFTYTWTDRTFCADDYVTERCSNFKGDGRQATAPEACYEENPKGGQPEACPAPVKQLEPAVPGSVTPLEPKGKPLPQRPRPKEEEGEGAAAGGLEGLPPGAVPPTEGAPPPEEAPPPAE
jgi:parvulin-like peptidyl-prolyl isomerase